MCKPCLVSAHLSSNKTYLNDNVNLDIQMKPTYPVLLKYHKTAAATDINTILITFFQCSLTNIEHKKVKLQNRDFLQN